MAGNVPADIARDHPRVAVITAAGRRSDHDGDGLAAIEIFDRIGQGVESGQLTPGETAHLERQEQRIDNQVKAERAANGGHLTAAERRQVNREQNRESRRIYAAKHNARHE